MTDASVTDKEAREPDARSRLMNAAVRLFAERGFHATRVSDIVQAAGVAQGTFYLYFARKDAIFVDAVDRFFGEVLSATLGQYSSDTITDAAQIDTRLAAIWRVIIRYCRANPELTALVLEESQSLGPDNRAHVDRHRHAVVEGLNAYTSSVVDRGFIPPIKTDLAAWVVLGMVERAAHYAVFVAPDADIDAIVTDLVRMELTGLLGQSGGGPWPGKE